jgi:hypothetical protein
LSGADAGRGYLFAQQIWLLTSVAGVIGCDAMK